MRIITCFILILSLLFAPAAAVSAQTEELPDWIELGSSDDYQSFIRTKDIVADKSRYMTIWIKLEYYFHEEFKTIMFRQEYDCQLERSRVSVSMTYYVDGTREADTAPRTWKPVIPDSTGDLLLRLLCTDS